MGKSIQKLIAEINYVEDTIDSKLLEMQILQGKLKRLKKELEEARKSM